MRYPCLSRSDCISFLPFWTLDLLLVTILSRLTVGRGEAKRVVSLLALITLEDISDLLLPCALLPLFARDVLLLLCET